MPWRLKREIYFILLGAAAIVLSMIVAVRDKSLDTELLAWLGFIGGLAMIINSLPIGNGKDQ